MFLKKSKPKDNEVMPETIGPWEMLDEAEIEQSTAQLRTAFPDLNLAPIARRLDNDQLACFDKGPDGTGKKVVVVKPDGAPGIVRRHSGFLEWFDAAIAEAKEG